LYLISLDVTTISLEVASKAVLYKISLDSYLLSIYDIVNKSIYCSATFEDTEVTIK
jgi:hypothetical protein